MQAKLDGQFVFDGKELNLKAESWGRDLIERTIPGLNGILTIDLGLRGRKIRQTGELRAPSEAALREKISAINACLDGNTHILVTNTGEELNDLRIDHFHTSQTRLSGSGVCCNYEILYTQLRG